MSIDDQVVVMSDVNPWILLDAVVSYVAAVQNHPQPSWWLERDTGSATYRVRVKCGSVSESLWETISRVPYAEQWLAEHGWKQKGCEELTQLMVEEAIGETTWNAVRVPAEKVVRSAIRRPPPLLWTETPSLRHAYWNHVCSTPNAGREVDRWAYHMRQDLSAPPNNESILRAKTRLRTLLARRPDWEMQAHQSWHVWAAAHPQWTDLLVGWGVSFRTVQKDMPLALWAIENNWPQGLWAWLAETNVSALFVPNHQDLPPQWKTAVADGENVPTGSLWHWSCFLGHPALVADLLAAQPHIVNAQDVQGRTGLHWACAAGRVDVVDMLLEKGAGVDFEDGEGHLAAEMLPMEHDELFDRLERRRRHSFMPPDCETSAMTAS